MFLIQNMNDVYQRYQNYADTLINSMISLLLFLLYHSNNPYHQPILLLSMDLIEAYLGRSFLCNDLLVKLSELLLKVHNINPIIAQDRAKTNSKLEQFSLICIKS